MKNLSFVFIAALSVAAVGCKKKSGDADCAAAINHSMELSKSDMQKMGTDDKMMAKMTDLGIQHCKDDKWPADATKCMTDAKTMQDAQACYSKLTSDQRDKMNKAAMEMMTANAPTPPAGSADMGSAAAGSAMAGSDMGSAAAGSAMAGSDMGSAGSAAAGSAGSAGSAAH